ncbi:MAG: 50S ribosomal protein L10 [Rectinema sp.]|jgi:large subunit ribosomal protein L10|uniref:Large ribosomal subunit protein uL10 n=1 Tax=uncultured spirochete TaxID=156406 RepID=A0A3P3XNH3_9SPIR|nr:50S ribosomal protein L10 [uncultured spirochete]
MAIKASKIQPKKVEAIGMLKEMISGSNDFIFTEYRGLTVERITALRHQLREKGVELHVIKNNFARLAFEELGYSDAVEPVLRGPTAVAFVKTDSNEVAKILLDFAKETPSLVVKGAMVDRQFMDSKQIEAFSKLPGRSQLIAMLMSAMQAPAQNLVYVINAIPTKLVRVLKAIEEKKAQSGAN